MVEIREARDAGDLAEVRALFLEYQQALGVDLCFQGFAQEVASLPGNYVCLLLAAEGRQVLGCAGLRPFGESDGEMKRLYVRPAARGRGVGRALVARVLERARAAGYHRVVLDTLPSMSEARALYRSFGFSEIAPYYPNPIRGTSYLALPLAP